MSDDPNKKRQDRKRVSQQSHEQAYQKRKGSTKSQSTAKGGSSSKRSNQKEKSR